jgi:hypothetical protein
MRLSFALFLVCFAVASGSAQDKEKKTPEKPYKDKNEAVDKLHRTGHVTGKLVEWGQTDQKNIVLMVTIQVPNPGGIARQAQLEADQARAGIGRNARDTINQIADIQKQMAENARNMTKDETIKMEFEPGEDVVYRTQVLPPYLDEKGKPRKPTDKEKKEARGADHKLPGYTASRDDLKNDQIISVYFKVKKPVAGASRKKEKDGEPAEPPTVTMVVIEVEPRR